MRELRRRALAFGFGFVTLAVFALLVAIYLQLAYQILWGGALAILFYPLHRRIHRLARGRETLAAFGSTIVSLAILFIPATLLVFNLVSEVQDLWPRLQEAMGPNAVQELSARLEDSPFRGVLHFALGTDAVSGPAVLEEEIRKGALGLQEFLLDRLRDVTKGAPGLLVQVGITVVVFFFFLRHGPSWVLQAQKGLPLAPEHASRLFTIGERTINGVFRGVVLTAATQAVLAGAGYWAAGAKLPILLAFATFITALIPFVGPVAIWLPVAIGLYFTGHQWAGIGLTIWGTAVVSLVDNILRPYLIGRETKLPLLWLFLAIVGGLKLFGFLGVVLGPATLAVAAACYRIFMEERRTSA